mmetsp:Transcript_15804/g.26181  ORF Transcript_15804/g.26181 Transcript_15804/m.26181 type:complete len:132 (+) Transcript_15804:106-501(+)
MSILFTILSLVFSQFIRLTVGVILPTYRSLQALKFCNAADDQVWLSYWIVLGFTESFLVPLMTIIPYTNVLFTALYLWLQLPQTEGAKRIQVIVLDYLDKHEGDIRQQLEKWDTTLKDAIGVLVPVAKKSS